MENSKLQKLVDKRAEAMAGGGEKAIEKHHAKGSFTARERINMLLDEGSFEEVDMFLTHRCTDFGMDKKVFLRPKLTLDEVADGFTVAIPNDASNTARCLAILQKIGWIKPDAKFHSLPLFCFFFMFK